MFFPDPGRTLGRHPAKVTAQTEQGYPENVSYEGAQVAFDSVHNVGSNNSLAPWTGNAVATPEQTAEVIGRTAADIGLIRDTFRLAKAHRDGPTCCSPKRACSTSPRRLAVADFVRPEHPGCQPVSGHRRKLDRR